MSDAVGAHIGGIEARRIDAAPTRKPSWRAFAIALALHAALALLFRLSLPAAETDDDGGAAAIEVEFESVAPKIETTDATPGPAFEAAAAAPDSAQQEVRKEAVETQDVRTPSVENAEIVARDEQKKPERETPDAAAAFSADSTASAAAQDSAPPVVLASLVAPISRAKNPGAGQSELRASAAWRKKLAAHLARQKSWPTGVARRDAEVAVRFRLERNGRVALAEIARSSGLPAFDDAALALMTRADPAPAPPAHVADDALTFTVPIVFRLRER